MLYQEIALKIAEKINNNQESDKLPTEKSLIAEYDASRNTVRNALKILMDAGLLISKAGIGYFVNHWKLNNKPTINFNMRNSFTRQFYADSKAHEIQVLDFQEVKCPGDVAKMMNIDPDETMYLVKRHRDKGYYNENFEFSLFRQKLIPYLNEDIAKEHIFEFIQKHYQIVDEHSDYYIQQTQQDNPFKDYLSDQGLYVTAIHYNNQESFGYSEVYYTHPDTAFYIRS